MSNPMTARHFHEAKEARDWRVVGDGACAYFRTGTFATGARFVSAISELADLDTHPPDMDLRLDGVTVRLLTTRNDYYGMSDRDLELAGYAPAWWTLADSAGNEADVATNRGRD
jgi:4a-hydroxytetrahydrobiopterin dehydratase